MEKVDKITEEATSENLENKGRYFDRAAGLCVVLDEDYSKSDLENLKSAIMMLKGVVAVNYLDYDGFHDYNNRVKVKVELRRELKKKINDILEF